MRPGLSRRVLERVLVAIVATLVTFGLAEALLRVAYGVRMSMIDAIPLPYAIGDEYGPAPPWNEDLRLLDRDASLMWRSRPGVRRRYVDVFTPVHVPEDRLAL